MRLRSAEELNDTHAPVAPQVMWTERHPAPAELDEEANLHPQRPAWKRLLLNKKAERPWTGRRRGDVSGQRLEPFDQLFSFSRTPNKSREKVAVNSPADRFRPRRAAFNLEPQTQHQVM